MLSGCKIQNHPGSKWHSVVFAFEECTYQGIQECLWQGRSWVISFYGVRCDAATNMLNVVKCLYWKEHTTLAKRHTDAYKPDGHWSGVEGVKERNFQHVAGFLLISLFKF